MAYAEVRDRMVACGLYIYTGDIGKNHPEVDYQLGHVECQYGIENRGVDYILTGYVLLDRGNTISADQFECFLCKKVMGPEADSVRSAATSS